MVTKLPDYAFLYVLELNNGFIINFGYATGDGVERNITYPIAFKAHYFGLGMCVFDENTNNIGCYQKAVSKTIITIRVTNSNARYCNWISVGN